MTADDAERFVNELHKRRPGRHLVQFGRLDAGSAKEPWSTEPSPFRSKYPCPELWDNGEYAARRGWKLPEDCRLVFGLGSIYLFVDAGTNEVLYLGRAGNTPAQYRIQNALRTPDVSRTLSFPRHRWTDRAVTVAATEVIHSGSFYVVFIVNLAPWGTFEDPFGKRPGSPGMDPYVEISKDLESWVMQLGGIPPLNLVDERRRQVMSDEPWGERRLGGRACIPVTNKAVEEASSEPL